MGDLSTNFSRYEFGCKCSYEDCVDIAVDSELVKVLQDVRDRFKAPVGISSSYRCVKHNRDEGGGAESQHLLGKAADIAVEGVDPSAVHKYLSDKYFDKFGIGRYNSFTHIDVRNTKVRWDFR